SKVIHLVRHPASILQSDYYRLVKGSGFKFLRRVFFPKKIFWPFLLLSCISWITGNILVELVRYFGRDRVLRVRYEDLISSPKHEIERIEKFIDINLDSIKSKIINNIPFSIGHNIGGNHMRMSGSFIFDPSKSKRNGLPRKYRLMANIVCGPLLWVYGYRTLTE
ncbi:MAG: sulfotransferase, partial [Desulfobulbaceae bacterium]|nr:sulfotransferase [Desulfobulbaceae bacterium]